MEDEKRVREETLDKSSNDMRPDGIDEWECRKYVMKRLSKGPMRLSDLRRELYFEYRESASIHNAVIERLKNDKKIEIGWSNSVGEFAVRRVEKYKK